MSVRALELRHHFAGAFGKRGEKGAAVGFGEDAIVEDGAHAFVLAAADEATDALAEFDDGFGDGVFHEGVDALFLEVFDAGGGDGVVGDGEGESGDDDVAESFAGDIDAGPEAVGSEENTVGVFFEFFEHLMAGHAATLDKELPVLAGAVVFEEVGHGLHLAVAGEEDKGAAV